MGFWIFILIMDLIVPFTMIGFGRYFLKKAPNKINVVLGYRTTDCVGIAGGIICGVQLIPLIGTVFPTELERV